MWGVGPAPLLSSAGHKGEEDVPGPFLAATPPGVPRPEVLKVGGATKSSRCLVLEQFAEDAL